MEKKTQHDLASKTTRTGPKKVVRMQIDGEEKSKKNQEHSIRGNKQKRNDANAQRRGLTVPPIDPKKNKVKANAGAPLFTKGRGPKPGGSKHGALFTKTGLALSQAKKQPNKPSVSNDINVSIFNETSKHMASAEGPSRTHNVAGRVHPPQMV
jgi:hypothetical protein